MRIILFQIKPMQRRKILKKSGEVFACELIIRFEMPDFGPGKTNRDVYVHC